MNENNPTSLIQSSSTFADVADVFQGSAARKVERRSLDRSTHTAQKLTPVDQRVAELSDDLSRALETSARQNDQLVTAQRELKVKNQQVAKLQAELASAKKQLGITTVNTTTPYRQVGKVDLIAQQKDVIDVLDELVQEGNRGFQSVYHVLDPIKRMLLDGHSVILSQNNTQGEDLVGLTDVLEDYAEKYQLSIISVEGKLAEV